jgi:hypothetical protein
VQGLVGLLLLPMLACVRLPATFHLALGRRLMSSLLLPSLCGIVNTITPFRHR